MGEGSGTHDAIVATTGEVIAGFVAPALDGPGDPLRQVLDRRPAVTEARRVEPVN